MRAQAEVHSAAAEADVRVGASAQIQALRVLKDFGVPVAGWIQHHHLLPGPDGLTADFEILCGRAAEGHYWGGPADELLDRPADAVVEIFQQPGALVGIVGEG